ncbi:hypothetical protein [Streptomyces cinereospinus]|uniref:Uncharacterized protein n=1 Tax=Streptomyces cinereospinus TaxID=285561 RepID=A0ABV5MU68_9ACTN
MNTIRINKNVRRSLVMAAGVTGAWALGSAAPNADELPVSSLTVPDPADDAEGPLDGVTGVGEESVAEVTSAVTDRAGSVGEAAADATGSAAAQTGQAAKIRGGQAIAGARAARAAVQAEAGTTTAVAVSEARATDEVAPFAAGVAREAGAFAAGVAPFAQDLTATAQGTGGSFTGHAVTGARGVTGSLTPGRAQGCVQEVPDAGGFRH